MQNWGWNGIDNSWNTWIIVSPSYDSVGYADSKGTHNELTINLNYCTSESEWNQLKDIYKNELNTEYVIESNLSDFGEDLAGINEDIEDSKEKLKEIALKVLENPIGTAVSYFVGMLRDALGDSFQKLANTITFTNIDMTYTSNEISNNSEINKYVNIGSYKKDGVIDKQNQKVINIDEIDSDEKEDKRFSEDTEIPLIMIELYNIAADNVPFFDINFLVVDESKHPEGSAWRNLRNFATAVVHIVIYIVSAFLILMLIYNGIKIVTYSLDSPEAKKRYKEGLHKFALSLLMLVGTIVIMALSIYGSNIFLDNVKVKNSEEGPIRVNVEEAKYSFSTTITGYFRYMAEIEGVNRCLEKGVYAFCYIVLAFINLLLASFMVIRMLGMLVLSMLGPILVGLNTINIKSPMKYSTWIRLYVSLAAVQIIFTLVYQVIFKFTIEVNSTI